MATREDRTGRQPRVAKAGAAGSPAGAADAPAGPTYVALRLAYDGAAFPRGYQRQPDGGTVEDAVIAALREDGYVDGSWRTGSRTDRGVSAAANVAACALRRPHLRGLVPTVAAHLPDGVWLTGVAPVSPDWNPRHAASRTYLYFAPDDGADEGRLRAACTAFVGRHDMRAFARLDGGRDPMREVSRFEVDRIDGGWRFTVEGPSFLWNQVRRMVDAVVRVGGGADPAAIVDALQTGRPHGNFKVAAPSGLVLADVRYDPALDWLRPDGTRRLSVAWQRGQALAAVVDGARDRSGTRRRGPVR